MSSITDCFSDKCTETKTNTDDVTTVVGSLPKNQRTQYIKPFEYISWEIIDLKNETDSSKIQLYENDCQSSMESVPIRIQSICDAIYKPEIQWNSTGDMMATVINADFLGSSNPINDVLFPLNQEVGFSNYFV